MKQHLRFLFTLLLAIVYGGALFGQTTVTQTSFSSTSADNLNGDKKVSYSCAQEGGTANPIVKDNEIRLYQKKKGKSGGSITIKVTDANYEINSVSVGSSMGTSVAYTIDSETTLSKSALLAANSEYSLTGLQATSVTFYCMGTTEKTRLYVNKLSVTYSEKGAEKTQTQLTFPKDSYSFSITDDLSFFTGQTPTLKAGESELTGKTITYSKTGDDIFTSFEESTGNLALNGKAGTATVTAKFAGDATYAASSASYTIHATKVPVTLSLAQTEDFHINYGADEGIKMIENKATLTPAEAGSVKYEISYNSVAGITNIDDKGTVMVDTKKIGNSTIKVSFVNKDANTYADVAPVTYKIYVDDNRAIPTLTFGKESYTFDLGATVAPFTNQLTAPEGVTVVYSSNSEIATVDKTTGVVTVNTAAVGKATITATFAGNDSYKPATTTYMLEVVDPNNMEATFDFEKPEDYGYVKPAKSEKTDLKDGDKLVSGKATLTNVKGATTTTRFKDDKGDLTFRVYTGAVLTVSAPEGYVITKMDFTDNGSQTVSNFDFDSGKLNNKTWTGSAQNVKMTVRANQAFLKKLVVAYAKKVVPTLETLTTAASGFATYAADYDVKYSALGLTAYTIALDEANNKVSYNRFEGVVPAGKAVLVQGTASASYELTPAEEAADATFTTDLKASDGTVTAADDKVYAFGTLNGKSGFKLVTDGIKIPAKKGYLELTGATAAKPTFFAFDGIGTGISHIEADAAFQNAAIYNLAGQRVDKSYKGVVIIGGKKMLCK